MTHNHRRMFHRPNLLVLSAAIACTLPQIARAAATSFGLDTLGDEGLVQEMARYGTDNLLDRYFQTNQTSAEQQTSIRAMMSIRTLLANGNKMSVAQRQQLVRQIVNGADAIVPTMRDPRQLMLLATALITNGMERSANTIEYWGENPRSQAEIRPSAELVARVLDLCSQRAREQADKLVASFGSNPTAAQQKEYTALDNLSTTAHYTRLMADYYRAMAYPQTDPQRAKIADAAIEGLKEYDATDSQIQPIVRLRIGKLQMVKGDYAAARKMLGTVATNPDKDIEPAPDVLQQYEARYFTAVCDVLSGNAAATEKDIAELTQWQEQNLPQDKPVRDGANVALAMLNYRTQVLNADLANGDAAKKEARDKADALLAQLAKDRPELRGVIYEQLVKSVADDAPVSSLDTLMLKAVVQQGVAEQLKPEGTPFDKKTVERAIAAAREIIARKSQPGASPDMVDDAAIVLPQLLEKLGQDPDAAKAYLAYIETSKNNANRAAAMVNALLAIERARVADPNSPQVQELLNQALPLAVNQLGRKELAYDLGRRLQQQGKYADAIAAYQLVPKSDKRFVLAEFFRMQSMKLAMDTAGGKLDAAQRQAQVEQIGSLAEEVRKLSAAARASATSDADKSRYSQIEARACLMIATLAKETDPAIAVKTLAGFEQSIEGLPGADELEAEALFLRTHSLMAQGENKQATDALLQLLQKKGGDQGASLIFGLLTKLDADLDAARKANDSAKVKSLLDARAALSGPLVDWARNNKDERIRKYTYQYMVFDAATKKQAAMADPDPQKRVQGLRQALVLYDKLLDGNSIKLWAATVDPTKVDVQYGDVAVLFAKAKVLYELAEYRKASERLARLLEDRKLGMPRIISTKDGEVTSEENPSYWEATLLLYRSNIELANDPATPNAKQLLEDTRNGLKRLYIREGIGVGGAKYKDDFTKLRKQIIPDFSVEGETAGR